MKSIISFFRPVIYRIQRLYWFITQPATFGAKVLIMKGDEMLLVEHTYMPGFMLPGGQLKKDEKPIDAAKREIQEELGLELHDLHELGFVTSQAEYKFDTVYLFRAEMPQAEVRTHGLEIKGYRFQSVNNSNGLGSLTLELLKLYNKA